MATPLEKARKDPDSMKGRILFKARQVFGEYGYHGATTRMIAEAVGIDISTLYYHWGEKSDLYQAVVQDVNDDLREKLAEVERMVHGEPLARRMEIAIDVMTSYLFDHREISNLTHHIYFGKTRDESIANIQLPEIVTGIARSMGLATSQHTVSKIAKLQVLTIMNSIHNFVSGEEFFRSMISDKREQYIRLVKETLKSVLIPAFNGLSHDGGT